MSRRTRRKKSFAENDVRELFDVPVDEEREHKDGSDEKSSPKDPPLAPRYDHEDFPEELELPRHERIELGGEKNYARRLWQARRMMRGY